MKLKVKRGYEISHSGVTRLWVWECGSQECKEAGINLGEALFWENAMRGARHHLIWHKKKAAT